ncbi:MAG TPA: NrfD/PsrC family molybdoenzyme membrane anchor subunit [Polyangia bacterium]|jgi:Ni/Fe-hydrogenase subunit HybB-like protein
MGPGVSGFVFPNEIHVTWTVMIVLYPYITGLVAGAFIVSSLYHLFGKEALRPVSRFALVSSLVFLLFAPLPLLLHLGLPFRALNIMITPSSSSAMAGFGIVYLTYLLIVIVEVWFALREDIVQLARARPGALGRLFRILALGDLTIDEHTKALDHKVVRFLAAVGIPVACFLHGYVGFLFGSIKANPWWSTPLLFVIFLLSAIVSGISVLVFLFYLISWLRRVTVDRDCAHLLANYLWGFMIVDVALEIMEVLSIAYEQTEEWEALGTLIRDKLFGSYVILQLLICSLVPFLLLGVNAVARVRQRVANAMIFVSAVLLLLQVLAMRWNVVIGGQLMSKSFRGYTSYVPGILDKEGLIVAVTIFTVPFLLLRLVDRIVPLFPGDTALGAWRSRRS